MITISAVLASCLAISCTSENKQEKMWDTSINADTNFIGIDTSGVADTSSIDSLYFNSPARPNDYSPKNYP